MPEHLLAVVACPGRQVLARVAGLVLPSGIEIMGMQCSHPPGSGLWWIQLTVRVSSREGLELLTKRLNRLVDVRRVVILEPDGHRTQSMYIRLQTAAADLVRISELIREFSVEIVEATAESTVLHVSASPGRCSTFVSMVRPYGVVEVVMSAVSGFVPANAGLRAQWRQRSSKSSRVSARTRTAHD